MRPERLNILVVTPWFPSVAEPVSGTFVAEQARALAVVNNVSVMVAASGVGGIAPARLEDSPEFPFRVNRAVVAPRKALHLVSLAGAVAAEARRVGCDLIHVHVTLPTGTAACLAGSFARVPVVLTEHRSPFSDYLKTRRDRLKVRFTMRRADAVIAVSSALRETVQPWAGKRAIDVVSNVVDTEVFKYRPRVSQGGADKQLLFVGRLNSHVKNVNSLLRALKLLSDGRQCTYRLRLVGEGHLFGELREAAVELGVADQCEFLGFLDRESVAREMANCDLLVLPSLAETFGVVVAEALCVGRPVVATRCGGPEELVTLDSGLLVPPGDDAALAEGIDAVCRDLDRYDGASIAKRASQRFAGPVIAQQLTRIYERVLAK